MLIEDAYRQYSAQMLQAMIRFSRDEAAAKDAVSHAFTQALVHSAMLEAMPDPAVKAWLYAAARNALVDSKRRERHHAALTDSYPDDFPIDDIADRVTVDALMAQLPAELYTPVYLKYYMGYNATEIGQSMNLPAATVRTRLRTALIRMRHMMKGE